MVRGSKVQLSKVALYWAVLTFGLALLWTVLLSAINLSGVSAASTLVVPMVLGMLLSLFLYYSRDHQVLEYDEDGYTISKGKVGGEKHSWSEFQECSVIRDGYGRLKTRLYVERDGHHFNVDSAACGINPYAFRNFASSRIEISASPNESPTVYDGFEAEIHHGRASWIADLNETFKDYRVAGERFPLVARGGTRPKGFLLSRFVAVTLMPNYDVCLYAHDLDHSGTAAKSRIMHLVRLIEAQRDQKNIKWSWLLLFSDEDPPESVRKFVTEFGNKDVGIGCIDVATGRIITSANQLGRSLSNQMRLNVLIRDLRRRSRSSYV